MPKKVRNRSFELVKAFPDTDLHVRFEQGHPLASHVLKDLGRNSSSLTAATVNNAEYSTLQVGNRRYGAVRCKGSGAEHAKVTDNSGLIYPSTAADGATGSIAEDKPHTFSLWFKASELPGVANYLFSRAPLSGDLSGLYLLLGNTGGLIYRLATSTVGDGSANNYIDASTASGIIIADKLYHLGVTYDAKGLGGIKVYLNGELLNVTHTETGTYAGLNPEHSVVLDIGAYGGAEFEGQIAEFAYFNRELSATEIREIYNIIT